MTEQTDPTEAIQAEPAPVAPPAVEPAPIDRATAYTAEPATDTAAAGAGAVAPTRAAAGATRARWLIAAVVVVAALAVVAGAAILLGSRQTPEALSYVPADMMVVTELRMDLPGDQLQKVGNLLAHFPGFKDQSTLGQKITESLSKLTTRASNGTVDYATKIQPWLAGPLFAGFALDPQHPDQPHAVLVATTDGTADCAAMLPGGKTAPLGSLTMTTNADGTEACVRDGRFGLLGTPTSIQAALDAHSKHTGVDTDSTYRAARDALGGDRLATAYVSGRLYTELPEMMKNLPSASPGSSSLPASNPFAQLGASAAFPSWAIFGVSAEDDAIVEDTVVGPPQAAAGAASHGVASPLPSLLTPPPDHASTIAGLVPGDTLALAETHGVGIGIENVLTIARSRPDLQSTFAQVDSTLAALGGAQQLVGWVDDLGVVVMPDGSTVAGGVILTAADDATATARAQQLLGFVRIAALSANLQTRDVTIGGVNVTLIEGDLGALAPSLGAPVNGPSGTLSIAVAVKGSAVYIGSGETFAHKVLELAPGSSLADQAGYKALVQRTADKSAGSLYVAGGRAIALVEPLLPAQEKASFETDIKPYVDPFDSVYAAVWRQGDLTRARLLVTVK
jgi:Protein of unknown function (DUF3352)